MTFRPLACAVLLLAPAWASADDFDWRGRLAPGKTLEVKGVNGGIAARPAGGGEAVVTASKSARRSDPASVEIKVVEHAGGVVVCAVYPSTDGRPNECAPGEGGRLGARDNDVKVEFTVDVPEGVRFVARTVNGGVDARNLTADADVRTVNGGISVSTTGTARAETVNGSITASMGRADWSGPLKFETVNGSIEVSLPDGVGAEVDARTVNGRIDTAFPLTARGRFNSRSLRGTIGGGGRQLDLETVNGSISLKRL
ncbi:MAG TPA: DUF4097 family beta strand repeat-containing protein [Vicinamibacteria bacterium]|jgi:hypothetical protein